MPKSPGLKVIAVAGLAAILGMTGCASAVSTHVTPDPEKCGWRKKRLEGVPITVKVPTHLEIQVVERCYLNSDGSKSVISPARFVNVNVREKDQVFTVDAVRPASGTLNYLATFQGQYFKTFNSKVEDKTIQSITDAITGITGELGKLPKAKSTGFSKSADDAKIPYVESLVAVREFDVHDPNLECEVRDFLHTYICFVECPKPCK